MKRQTDKSPYLLPALAAVAALLFGSAGVVRVMGWGWGWLPNANAATSDMLAMEPQVADNARPKRRCPECGVIASMHEIESSEKNVSLAVGSDAKKSRPKAAKRYEFIVRLEDGSQRAITDANSAAWRLGERVSIIDGIGPSDK